MASYFYCGSTQLAPGSVIEPGNWGRMLGRYTREAKSNAWVLVRELKYEEVRRAHFPAKPSRLASAFLCPTQEHLKDFMAQQNRVFDLMYEVELVDPAAPLHVGDWTLPRTTGHETMAVFEAKAHQYWQGATVAKPEVVTTSAVRVLKRL